MQEMKRRETEILVHNVQFRTYMYVDRLLFSGSYMFEFVRIVKFVVKTQNEGNKLLWF